MQAVILAGGKGVRLRPLTEKVPKPLVHINNKPFLQYLLERLKAFGFIDVLLLVSHLGKQIEAYFGNGEDFGLRIEYAHEATPLGTAGALKNAEDKLEKVFLLLNGDTYLPLDYGRIVDAFHRSKKTGLVTVYANKDSIVTNNISVEKANVISGYNKKSSVGMTYVDAGIMVLKKDIVKLIPGHRECSLEEDIFPQLIEKQQLAAFPTEQRFFDMGTPGGLKQMEIEGILQ